MKKVNPKQLCLNCFATLSSDRVCPVCGKKDEDETVAQHILPRRTVLHKQYVIAKLLGEGGFGITYLAYDLIFSRPVAIKEFFPDGAASRNVKFNNNVSVMREKKIQFYRGLDRFNKETKRLASLENLEGIVSIYNFFRENNTSYIVMEYLDGVSLKRYVQKKGKLPVDTVLTILHPVISSLSAVHNAGIIHRDISPDNILITRQSEVKLIDFGASLPSDGNENEKAVILKQGFAPEEQYRLSGIQGPWSDIYALAVTIYYCLTCTLPPESVQRLYEDTLIPPSKLGSDILPHQEKALLKAMAVLASDRYGNIADFEKDIYAKKPREDVRKVPPKTEEKYKTRTEKGSTISYKTLKRLEEEKTTKSQKSPKQAIIDNIFSEGEKK